MGFNSAADTKEKHLRMHKNRKYQSATDEKIFSEKFNDLIKQHHCKVNDGTYTYPYLKIKKQ